MSKLDPKLELEKQLGKQIYTALQGEIVEEVLRKTKTSSRDAYWRSSMEGHSLRVQKELLPDIYKLCQDVKKKLNVKDEVDFYITGDSDVNAFSLAAEDEGEHHIVNVNSALFDLMSEDELRFVIGHELGHLINKDTALARLINFVFPEGSAVPVTLQYKIRLHEQLAELVADRYGYMATEDLGVCVTAFFKMASGLDLEKMNVSIDALIADNSRRLDYFLELQKGMDELISILLKVGDDELDEHMARFIASAGLIVASSDDEMKEDEINQIIEMLARLKIFPRKYLEEIAQGDVVKTFNESVEGILKINPGMRSSLLEYMIHIALSDKIIARKEVDLLYEFGASIALSEMEVATAIAESVQRNYLPSLESIC